MVPKALKIKVTGGAGRPKLAVLPQEKAFL
jgi:hypothetical protein